MRRFLTFTVIAGAAFCWLAGANTSAGAHKKRLPSEVVMPSRVDEEATADAFAEPAKDPEDSTGPRQAKGSGEPTTTRQAKDSAVSTTPRQAKDSATDPPVGTASPRSSTKKPFTLGTQKFGGDAEEASTTALSAGLTQDQLKRLSEYSIELIVDHSMSMQHADCPGPKSRWDWCGDQACDLAKALAPFIHNGFTITLFGAEYSVYPNSDANKIISVFTNYKFALKTKLAEALADRFNAYFMHRTPKSKPLLVAIITDGVPSPQPQPFLVRDVLIEATKRMKNPREVAVAFFQIGGKDPRGQSYLANLDANLVNEGGRYDIVHTKMFDQLMVSGLGRGLNQVVQECQSGTKPKLDPVEFSGLSAERFEKRMQHYGIAP